jgi:hypothetical protein
MTKQILQEAITAGGEGISILHACFSISTCLIFGLFFKRNTQYVTYRSVLADQERALYAGQLHEGLI